MKLQPGIYFLRYYSSGGRWRDEWSIALVKPEKRDEIWVLGNPNPLTLGTDWEDDADPENIKEYRYDLQADDFGETYELVPAEIPFPEKITKLELRT